MNAQLDIVAHILPISTYKQKDTKTFIIFKITVPHSHKKAKLTLIY
jgi:hypothetical protein